jgi:transcriptional regulator with XRE-family HTH domain
MLDWTRSDLAEKSGVGFSSMQRLESAEGVPGAQFKTLEAIKEAFEKAGIEFIGTPDDDAGVRWKSKK